MVDCTSLPPTRLSESFFFLTARGTENTMEAKHTLALVPGVGTEDDPKDLSFGGTYPSGRDTHKISNTMDVLKREKKRLVVCLIVKC